MHYVKSPHKQRINASKTLHPEKAAEFIKSLEDAFLADSSEEGAQQSWDSLRDTIHSTALKAFGKKQRKTQDWFEASSSELTTVVEAKCVALLERKCHPKQATLQALRTARSKAHKTARHCANDYMVQLCKSIQSSFETGNILGVYEGIRKTIGSTQSKTAPLKIITDETIQDNHKQMRR
ncbi:hypothetical protein chiPu_0000251 [Chiloscyllium punctatum]|uniref:Uncharacterized protein n=1 Tax=Chiloscyllium punctatum TaxID=137246 RepID=A0A401RUN7_CHIPU|nr:hypothetical protein [Chiloscyllium punctatum]